MRLYLCGVRGSTPAPGAEFLRYGGHTSCVALAHDDAAGPALLLDAGTGLRRVTPLLGGQPFDGTILLTHLHWDHVHGLCPTALGPGPDGWDEYHQDALDLARGADVLLHDAFLLPDEVAAQAAFGHAAADYAIGLGQRAGARRVLLTHHKPDRTDGALDRLARRVKANSGDVEVAAEGQVLTL